MPTNLKNVSTHFAFGRNWSDYAKGIGTEQVNHAIEGLARLIPAEEMSGKTFFDIGCGSGLSMLAALRLGAAHVEGIDIDADSVATARQVLSAEKSGTWSANEGSVFDLDPARNGTFDIVHSWGVLHHTGDMYGAVENAARLVAPNGLFVIALYSATPLCGLWTHEKRFYTRAGSVGQLGVRAAYKAAYIAGLFGSGRNAFTYVKNYKSNRGMNWHHDVHDWLGGYPYESISPADANALLGRLGFTPVRVFVRKPKAMGFFGTHCDEFVARRASDEKSNV